MQAYISSPKHLPPKGISFTENKKFCALLERREARDIIGVYYAGNEWKMVNKILLDTMDAQDVKWVSSDAALLVHDTALESKIMIYSAATGDVLSKFEPQIDGLGVKNLVLSGNQ